MSTDTLKIIAQGDREIVITREFDAPRELVFEAWTSPALLKRWFGVFGGWSLDVCDIDLRAGGDFRYLWINAEGRLEIRGSYSEVVAPERIAGVERFVEPFASEDATGTTVFSERDGRTYLRNTVRYPSQQARDGALQSPMEHGMRASYNALDELLAKQRATAP
ncbi:SRPBCC family protein [Lysobacter sp. TAB13]|uniref:SRPBCC family protein n=1 Tax=Lysobacter sp. TAB13 TaxID=3233065 RepID=UPI003F9E91B5